MKKTIHKSLVAFAFRLSLCVACIAASTFSLLGQTFYGSIIGTVTDASGASIPGTVVTLTNLGTSERRAVETDAAGSYQFVNLIPGRYRVDIEMTGFKRFSREPVVVEVQAAVRIDASLEVGDVSETVEVLASTPLLQTENSSLGQIVESRKVLEMPLNGRNVFNLVALVPGVVPGGQSQTNPTGSNPFAWGNYQIGGGQSNQSASYIDGGPINVSYINLTSLVPTQDAIQEFRVQTNSLGPEFGRFAGGVINLTTKSGTNAFHGSAYEFLRNRVLNANTFFNNAAGVKRPAFTQNQFGANVGGPVFREKTFFFYGYEGFRVRQGQSFLLSVPTADMRRGDFSNLRDASGNLIPIYDPLTTCGRLGNAPCARDASGAEIISRRQFTNNVIPDNRIDPAARFLNNLWALPNASGAPLPYVNNFAANASVGGNNDQHNARVDQVISDKQRLFFRYTYWSNLNLPIDPFKTKTCVDRCTETFNTNQAVIGDTYVFTPTTIGDFRVAFLRFSYDRTPSSAGFDLTQLAWPSSLNSQVAFRALPVQCVQGFRNVLCDPVGTGSTILARNDSYSIAPSLTKIAGRHTWKFGVEIRKLTHNYAQTNNPTGSFDFDNRLTALDPFRASGGFGMASYLLGYGVGGGAGTPALVAGQQIYRGYYAGDTIQFAKLTVNLGLRFEQPGPWSERFDRLSFLLPVAENPLVRLRGRLGLVNSDDRSSRNPQDLKNLWAPRVGLAYRLNPKTVIRTGYGIFWLPNDVVFTISPNNNPINNISTPFAGTIDGSLTPGDRLSNPFPSGILQPPGRNPEFQTRLLGQGINGTIPDEPFASAQQWNFDVQRELPDGTVVDIAYAGSRGTHLPVSTQEINQLPEEFMSLGTALQQQVPNPFFGLIGTGTLSAATVSRGQLLRPFPQYTGVSIAAPGNRNSIYHSLQAKIEKRFSQGGSILSSYTWAKLITDTDTLTGWLEPGGGFGSQNNYNLRLERSTANYDVTHRLVVSYVLDLPFGKGRKFANGVSGVGGKLISGWGINGVSTFQSGFPLGLTNAVNRTSSFGGGSRPNSTGRSAKLEGPAQQRLARWFDTFAFTEPAPFTFGNVARTLSDVRSHGVNNFDFALFKNTQIVAESVGLQFRVEVFNFFNRVQFGYPGRQLGNPQFGVISGQYNNPRLVQFALRLLF